MPTQVTLDAHGDLSVVDTRTGKKWTGQSPLTVTCFDRQRGQPLTFSVGDVHGLTVQTQSSAPPTCRAQVFYKQPDANLKFVVTYTWKGDTLELSIPLDGIHEDSARFPLMNITPLPGWGSVPNGEDGYLFLPEQSGTICRFNQQHSLQLRNRIYGRYDGKPNNTTMPVYGVVHKDAAFVGILTGGECDAELIADVNTKPTETNSATIVFHYREMPDDMIDVIDRGIRFVFLSGSDAGYVGMAKAYRHYLITVKKVQSLREKARHSPVLDYYLQAYNDIRIDLGIKRSEGPGVKGDGKGEFLATTTFAEAKEVIDAVKRGGIDKATFILVGWSYDGADGAYPTKFPPDERLGGEQGLADLISHARSYGYQIVCWDNYTDSYELSDDWSRKHIQKNRDGTLVTPDWYWAGGLAYKICPEHGLPMIQSNIPKFKKLGFEGVWLCDAIPIGLYGCFDKEHAHPQTRRSIVEGYRKIAATAQKAFGGCHVENAHDYMAGVSDAISCTPIRRGVAQEKKDEPFYDAFFGTPVPFYQVAYHGLVSYHLYAIDSTKPDEQELLREIEHGALPRIELRFILNESRTDWLKRWVPVMKNQYDVLCGELGHLQFAFIENHREVAPSVFETTYSEGTRVLVNYSNTDYEGPAGTCSAHDYGCMVTP